MTPLSLIFAPALLVSMQVGMNQPAIPLTDGHAELRDRSPQQGDTAEPDAPVSEWLEECLDQLETEPSRAHTMAQIRRNETSGPERVIANHCLGLAATELGLWEDARTAFLASRDEVGANEPVLRARAGTMAGIAALAGGDGEGALALLDTAIVDAQAGSAGSIEAYAQVEKARALVMFDRDEEALLALDRAVLLQTENPESWLLKATLERRLERLADAQASIVRAGELAPSDPLVGLEAGRIAFLDTRYDAARASWQSVADLVPDSGEGQLAREYISDLDAALIESAAEPEPQ